MDEKKICMVCKKALATVKVTRLVKGQVRETWMCARCALKRSHYHTMTPQAIISALIKKEGQQAARLNEDDERQCPTCGLPLRSYRETLFLGCSDCYAAFEEAVVHDLRRYHGSVQHCGRTPENDAATVEPRLAIRDLQRRLEIAVRREDFELAARLRDEIKRLKAQIQETESSSAKKEQ